ncbi:hypothetical protein L596_014709 [Steinernema carpocapsae]|uniref:ShKT domain-containing protein n=1 Tax=Steinernema carpocapsae TaxID=34508 RepID=A0A4U5NDM2_STECR|nr:hypothetical protein L596_014709 [Steinernema carpocapsae]
MAIMMIRGFLVLATACLVQSKINEPRYEPKIFEAENLLPDGVQSSGRRNNEFDGFGEERTREGHNDDFDLVKVPKKSRKGLKPIRLQQLSSSTLAPTPPDEDDDEAATSVPPIFSTLAPLIFSSSKSPDDCSDLLLCAPLSGFCKQTLYAGFVNVFCKKTCNLCESSCFDHNPLQCQIWAEDGSCTSPLLSVLATKVCAKSCNACGKK